MKRIDYFLSQESFELVFVQHLSAYRTTPVPKNLQGYYHSENYLSHFNARRSVIAKIYALAKRFRNRSKWAGVLSFNSSRYLGRDFSVLDFGSGDNSFVCSAPNSVRAVGYDPYAQSKEGKQYGTLEELVAENKSFDAITLWHSLEHTKDPMQILESLVSVLKPEGRLHIAVPNHLSWDAMHYKEYWAGYDVPRHLWHFSSESFRMFAKKLGLRVVEQKPHWLDAFYVSYLSEKYKGSRSPLFAGIFRTMLAVISKKAFEKPSAIYVVLEKPN